MINKSALCYLLTTISFFVLSCTKNGTPPVIVPELLDTLGTGWQRIKVDTTQHFEDIFFVDNQTGFLCGDKYLGKSVDGGLTWTKILPDSTSAGLVNLFFINANNGWVFGGNNSARTADGGTTWQKINKAGFLDGQFFDANNGYLIGGPSGLYKTTDGGFTFQSMNYPSGPGTVWGLYFLDQNNGWFSGSHLQKTENAGVSYSSSSSPISQGEYAIQFTDALHGWIAGVSDVYRTIDGGITLETIIHNSTVHASGIRFFDNNNGYILADGKIYSTADGGKTLTQLCAIHKGTAYEIHFTDPDHGWTTSSTGFIYKYVKP